MDDDEPKKKKEIVKPVKMATKKNTVKITKKVVPKEDPYAFTVETTTASPDMMRALTQDEAAEDYEPK